MQRRQFLLRSVETGAALAVGGRAVAAAGQSPAGAALLKRGDWLKRLDTVATPVLRAAAAGRLQAEMPVECAPGQIESRRRVTHLEAVGRTLAGVAPWLEHGPTQGEEGQLRARLAEWAQGAVAHGVDKRSPGYLRFGEEAQTVVDAAFLALAMARAPRTLREALPATTREQLAECLRATRKLNLPFNNWLLFAAMVECALFQTEGPGGTWDPVRVDYALREHAAWYLGDGVYGDGPHFHADYYNSFVIHPFLLAVLDAVGSHRPEWQAMTAAVHARAVRYAAIQERTIQPDGTYPPVGRSLTYRCGAFHLLADAAYRGMLPEGVAPEQVRGALGAVIRRTLDAPGTFDAQGWLRIGVAGHQPSLGEPYISTGSLYLCTAAFLPLGLGPEDRFWSGPDAAWTSQRLWSGEQVAIDHAIAD